MPTLWILHRDERLRGALARLAGAGEDAVLGAPGDAVFDAVPAPQAVVMGLAGDFERELEFAHRVGPRVPHAGWILLAERREADEARRLFDTLHAQVLVFPPSSEELRAEIASLVERRHADALSRRRARDALAERFSRWFADLDLPDLLRALDPALPRVPLLVRGEPGTGRHLLARYVHAFGGTTGGFFVHVPCSGDLAADDLRDAIAAGARPGRGSACVIWLQDVDTLSEPVQRHVQEWVEFGPPEGCVRVDFVRWMGSAGAPGAPDRRLDPGLARALSGISLYVPPLRERPDAIEPFVVETARAWCERQGQRPRRFSGEALEALRAHPWPGNLMELEAVVVRTLSSTGADPVTASMLRFEGEESARRAGARLPPPFSLPSPPPPERDEEELETALEALESLSGERAPAPPPGPGLAPPEPAPPPPPATEEEAVTELLPEEEAAEAGGAAAPADDTLRRLVGAVAHEVRNPLVAIRTLSELLPERYDDPEFRERFAELVGADVERIEDVVRRLGELGELDRLARRPVDAVALVEELLAEHRDEIERRRLLVLKELDYTQPFALGDPEALRDALAGVLDRALAQVPDRGDLFLASRHHAAGLRGEPSLRLLLRFRAGEGAVRGMRLHPLENALDLVWAEAVVRALGGTLTLDTSDAQETLLVLDLPAPA